MVAKKKPSIRRITIQVKKDGKLRIHVGGKPYGKWLKKSELLNQVKKAIDQARSTLQ